MKTLLTTVYNAEEIEIHLLSVHANQAIMMIIIVKIALYALLCAKNVILIIIAQAVSTTSKDPIVSVKEYLQTI